MGPHPVARFAVGLAGWRRVALLAGVALVARIVALVAVRGERLVPAAARSYEVAQRLGEGAGFSAVFPSGGLDSTAFVAPLQPFLVGTVFELTGARVGLARVLGVLIGVALVLAVDRLGVRVGSSVGGQTAGPSAGPVTGLVAALVAAVAPFLVVGDAGAVGGSLVALVAVLFAILAFDGRWLAAGSAGGLLVLARPGALVVVAVVACWVGSRFEWRLAGRLVVVAAVVVFPFVQRNALVLEVPVLSTSWGATLSGAYSVEARRDGVGLDVAADERFDVVVPHGAEGPEGIEVLALLDPARRDDEGTWNRALQEHALAGLAEHPRQLVAVLGTNSLVLLGLHDPPEHLTTGGPGALELVGALLWPVVAVAGLVGLWPNRRNPAVVLVGGMGLAFVVLDLLTLAGTATRAPIEAVACIGVGLLVAAVATRRSRTEPPPTAEGPSDQRTTMVATMPSS